MYRMMLLAGAVLACAAMTSAAKADSVSELLEKGIYTEETVGDLDKAISIYEEVVAKAAADNLLAARAQFNIGQCLTKKGKKAEATAAFEKLINDFPEAKQLVAKARKFVPAGLPLGPVPWVDGEVLQLRFRMTTGIDVGTIIYTSQSAELEGRKAWQVGSRTLVTIAKMNGFSRVYADWNTFLPIRGVFENSLMGSCTAKYTGNHVNVSVTGPDGKTTKKEFDLSKVVYDNEQAFDVIRRLPLAKGYKTTLSVLGMFGAGKVDIPIEVQGKEMVKVPAGEFECFKIHLGLVNQTFWYATDPHRYLVKFHAGGVDAELTTISKNKSGELRRYENKKLGLALTMPNDWYYYQAEKPLKKKHEAMVTLLDPRAIAKCYFFVGKTANLKTEKDNVLRTWADAGIAEASNMKKDLKVRENSWQVRKISGMPALSMVADYTDGKNKMVEYFTYVAAKSAGLKLKFGMSAPKDQFDKLRNPFDTIVDSLKVKQP